MEISNAVKIHERVDTIGEWFKITKGTLKNHYVQHLHEENICIFATQDEYLNLVPVFYIYSENTQNH